MKPQAIAPQEYKSGPKPPALFPVLLAGGSLVAVLLFCFIKDHHYPPINTLLSSAAPAPGMPLIVSGMKQGGGNRPLLEADFGSFSITQLPSKAIQDGSREIGRVMLLLPVAFSSCKALQRRLGGGCDDETPLAGKELEGVEVRPLQPEVAISMQLQIREGNVAELTQSTPSTKRSIPTAWAVRTNAAETDVTFGCPAPTFLLVSVPPHQQRVECVPGKAVFRLPIQPRHSITPIIFLNEVGRIEANLNGKMSQVGVLQGALRVGDNQSPLEGSEEGDQVEIKSNHERGVDAKLEDSVESEVANLTINSNEASTASVDGVDQIPSWLDRHKNLHYLLLGLAGGALIATLISYLAKRRGVQR